MIQEHKELLAQIGEAQKIADALNAVGENVGDISRNLRRAFEDTKKRLDYYTEAGKQSEAAPVAPLDPREELFRHSRNELIAIVDDLNTTPGRTGLIALDANANKTQIVDAILAAQTIKDEAAS